MAIRELECVLNNISVNNKRPLTSYTEEEIKHEARYVLSTFYESGHCNNEDLTCEWGDEDAQRSARQQVKALRKLLA